MHLGGNCCWVSLIATVALFEILPFKSFKYVCLDRRINPLSTSNSLRGLASNLIKCTRVMSKRLLTPWLMIILLCNFSVTLLDPRSYQDGKQ